jgi:aspartate racemase
MDRKRVGILLFNDVEVLDYCGPFEVFSVVRLDEARRRQEASPFEVVLVAETLAVVTTSGGMQVLPMASFADCPPLDILLVPGGMGTRKEMLNEAVLDFVKAQAIRCERMASVCTGALILGKAGLLDGLRATTHWGALDLMRELFPAVRVDDTCHVVDEGKVLTSAGISAGIDLALKLVQGCFGESIARATARYMEYPFPERNERRIELQESKPAKGGSSLKTIGLIGGMSWESTVPYYQIVNRVVAQQLGGLHSAKVLLYSVDFQEIEELQRTDRWDEAGALLAEAAAALERAGADFLVVCTNTMHKVVPAIEARVRIPLLHIADATAEAIVAAGHRKVALLGTRFTMEQAFYKARLEEKYGLEVITPTPEDRELVHRVIYDELCLGRILGPSRKIYRRIIQELVARGAQCVILGCTEISLLVQEADAPVPLFDTTALHARAAANWALGG